MFVAKHDRLNSEEVATKNIARSTDPCIGGVIAVSEAWIITKDEQEGHELAGESPKRREALDMIAVNKDQTQDLVTFFTRDGRGNVQLAGMHEFTSQSHNIMEPIIEPRDSPLRTGR